MTNRASRTQHLLELDAQYLSSALVRVFPIVVERAEGSHLHTVDGETYLDLTCGIAVNQLGHCHPEVVAAAQEQLSKLTHLSCVTHHTVNIALAERLASILPGDLENTFFCNSGAEGVDGAIKFARYNRLGRPNIIAFRGAFHGRTLGSTALSSSKVALRNRYDPLLPGVHFADYPNCWNCPVYQSPEFCNLECLDLVKRMFRQNLPPESVAAIIIEPVIGEGGYVPAPNHRHNFLRELRHLCDEHGIILIADEVQSGIGRTGRWFAVEHYGVVPDVIVMAKGLGNGLPIGGFAVRREFAGSMPPGSHGSTYGGNPVACAAALKTIEVIQRDDLLVRVESLGERVMGMVQQELGNAVKIRGYGFMIGIELPHKDMVQRVIDACFAKKILLLPAGVKSLRLIPAFNISEDILWPAMQELTAVIRNELSQV